MKIAIVEDDTDIARLNQVILEDAGHQAWLVDQHDLHGILDADVVIVDLMMPDVDGDTVLEWLAEHRPNARRIVTTARFRPSERVEELAHKLIYKPFSRDVLLEAVETQ